MKLDDVIKKCVAVRCKTEEEAKAFLAECDKHGMLWYSGARLTAKNLMEQK